MRDQVFRDLMAAVWVPVTVVTGPPSRLAPAVSRRAA